MLYVKGECYSCRGNEGSWTDKKTGEVKSGKFYTALILDKETGADPIKLSCGDKPLIPGKTYRIPVYPRIFNTSDGKAGFQLNTLKDFPPQELSAQAAK